jgi:hypothetical protein
MAMTAIKQFEGDPKSIELLLPDVYGRDRRLPPLTVVQAGGGLAVAVLVHDKLPVRTAGIAYTEALQLAVLSVAADEMTFEWHLKQWNVASGDGSADLLTTCGFTCSRVVIKEAEVRQSTEGKRWWSESHSQFAERLDGESRLAERFEILRTAAPETDVFVDGNTDAMTHAHEVLRDHALVSMVGRAAFGMQSPPAIPSS